MTEPQPETGDSPDIFTIERTFDAPRERVWKAWTEGEQLKQWFGPKGLTVFHASLDLRAGGLFHYGMKSPDGNQMWGKWMFKEIEAPEKLVFISSFSDPQGSVTRHPLAPGWPLETLSTVTLAADNGKTTVTVRGEPHKATEFERTTFAEGQDSLKQGWTGTFDQLEAFLA